MMEKKKVIRKTFAERLAEKLQPLGDVDVGDLSDNSASWVVVRVKDLCFCFTFDMKGEKIYRLGLYQDVIQKVDEREIASFADPKEYPEKPLQNPK